MDDTLRLFLFVCSCISISHFIACLFQPVPVMPSLVEWEGPSYRPRWIVLQLATKCLPTCTCYRSPSTGWWRPLTINKNLRMLRLIDISYGLNPVHTKLAWVPNPMIHFAPCCASIPASFWTFLRSTIVLVIKGLSILATRCELNNDWIILVAEDYCHRFRRRERSGSMPWVSWWGRWESRVQRQLPVQLAPIEPGHLHHVSKPISRVVDTISKSINRG
jgi:hypothetical protein